MKRDTSIPKKEDTSVTKWLRNSDAYAYIDTFYDNGYYKMEGVDEEAITNIVDDDKPGIVNMLKSSLAEYKKYASGEPMAPPKLPAGTVLDLSAPQLETPNGITFSVGKSLGVDRSEDAIELPNKIKPNDWMVIAHGANLLYAYDMDSDEPKYAKTPILDWKVPDRHDFVRSEISHAKVTSMLTYSEESASYVTSGFNTQTATAGYIFCAASFERNRRYRTAKSSQTKTIIQVGMWKYPRAQIYLDKCTVTSNRFIKAIQSALEADDKYSEVNKVFREYGHVIPSSVLLGGQLCYRKSYEINQEQNEDMVEEEWKTSLAAKKEQVSASIGFAYGEGSETKTGSVDLKEFSSFTNHGGDSLLCSNPAAWAPTVNVPDLWAVIEMEGMRSTIDLLDDETKEQVLNVWSMREAKAILNPVEIEDLQDDGGALYPDYYSDDHKNKAVIMMHSGFAVGMRQCSAGSRGSVQLLYSPSGDDPQQDDPDTTAGAAYAHFNPRGDLWIECNSICLPIPQGGSFKTSFEKTEGAPDSRLMFVPSNLRFGRWVTIEVPENQFEDTTSEDGFLFVNIEAADKERGGVKVWINNEEIAEEIAGSYVHLWKGTGEYFNQQNLCVPLPEETHYRIIRDPSYGNPDVRAYWMPLHDSRWKMQKADRVSLNTQQRTKTDGILHGWIRETNNGDRGTLKIYTGDDALIEATTGQLPSVGAAMHYYERNDRWVKYSSVTLPIAKGTLYMAVFKPSSLNPEAQLYWTAIVPR